MKKVLMFLAIFSLTACGEPNPGLSEDDIGVIPDDVNKKIEFAVVNSIYFEDLSMQAQCDRLKVSKDFLKITSADEYREFIDSEDCKPETVPKVDFNYFFLVFKPIPSPDYENLRPQVQIQDGTLALYNLPETTENEVIVTQPFKGWLAIPRKYINLPLQTFDGERLEV